MKYIRTQNDFFAFAKQMTIVLGKENQGYYYRSVMDRKLHRLGAGLLQEKYIIKQSDFLPAMFEAELLWQNGVCHFIEIDHVKNKYRFKYGKSKKYIPIKPTDDIRGAIWTNKGLVYIAKRDGDDWKIL